MKANILIIEDNEQNIYLATFLLKKNGYRVMQARDGREGIALARRSKPELILLDIQLPVMDGYAVAHELRQNGELGNIPIVAVTSYAMSGDRERVLAAGCTGYIEKPINPETFAAEIEKYLLTPETNCIEEGAMTKMLIVDDNRQSLYMLQVLLTGSGFEVEMAANGAEALEMARRVPPEMIISDILMPVMDGFALCRAWKADERLKDIPFVFYTATYTDPRDEELSLSLGAARFIVKPQDPEAFVALLRQVIKEYKSSPPHAPAQSPSEKTDYYLLYSETLVRKLEDKMLQLERFNRALEQEITARKQMEAQERLAHDVLDLLNRPESALTAISNILFAVRRSRGFEAVGIRMQEGDDFPYYETKGFTEEFVLAERRLCAYDEAGKIMRDEQGKAVLECMCGNVIRGRTDGKLPFFTEAGSFWTNSATDLPASTMEEDRQARTRNRCNAEGYESVALIPLRTGDEIIGLLQLNDCRRDQFTLEMIRFFEGLGASIGIAISRKRTEEQLRKSEDNFRRSLDESLLGVRIVSEEGETIYANRAVLDIFEYDSIEEWQRTPSVKRYTEQSYAEFKVRREKRRRGEDRAPEYEISIIRKDEEVRHLQVLRKEIVWNGKKQYQVIYRDITDRKQAEKERQQALDRLRKALGATVQALAAAAEIRDPYTAGHQRRVADLACAIGLKMGLLPEQIDVLQMAGMIHDIGKISVPAEILSMPRKLTDLEFSLIKTHSQSGYEVLKDIEFSWPVARMVLEHHERIDGSGYPNKLTGDKLLLESRIIAIADVVEAMASYRPYRPGLGIDAALEEIAKNRGILYDAEIADACLKLFRDDSYKLAS